MKLPCPHAYVWYKYSSDTGVWTIVMYGQSFRTGKYPRPYTGRSQNFVVRRAPKTKSDINHKTII